MFFGRKQSFSTMTMAAAQAELARGGPIYLIDVRTPEEFRGGHIPGAVNLPLDRISEISRAVPDRDAKVFVYCLSGARSRAACGALFSAGYHGVCDIGGISRWPGKLERKIGA